MSAHPALCRIIAGILTMAAIGHPATVAAADVESPAELDNWAGRDAAIRAELWSHYAFYTLAPRLARSPGNTRWVYQKDWDQVHEALVSLGPAGLPALINALGSDDYEISDIAGKAIESIGRGTIPELIEALDDESAARRRNAARCLGWLRPLTPQAEWAHGE